MQALAIVIGVALTLSGPGLSAQAPPQVVKLAVTGLVGMEELQREFGAFLEVIEQASGLDVEFYPVTNRAAASEALKWKRVDFVLSGPAEYVVMKKRAGAVPVVGFSRPDYFAAVFVLAESEIRRAADLKGKKVGFSTVGSSSGHLGPMQLLADYGVDPLKDIEAVHLKTQTAFEALKRGDIAALGFGAEKFNQLREDEALKGGLPQGAFRVVLRGPDLPNDVLMAGAHVPQPVIDAMRKVFVDKSDALIKAMLNSGRDDKYRGMKFLPAIRDADYDYVRTMYKTAGFPEYADFVGN